MTPPFRLCVFCGMRLLPCAPGLSRIGRSSLLPIGASDGSISSFSQAAHELAEEIHTRGWKLIYGGGARGVMGTLASSLVSRSGPDAVTGFIPRAMLSADDGQLDVPAVAKYGRTVVASDMHKRKLLMAQHADAFVALPGGFGTLEELLEIITWNQLGIHSRPIIIFNVKGFFDLLLAFLDNAVKQGMIPAAHSRIVVSATTAKEVMSCITEYRAVPSRYLLDWSKL